MMDTIFNIGLKDITVVGLQSKNGNERFVYYSFRIFIQMFDVCLGEKVL